MNVYHEIFTINIIYGFIHRGSGWTVVLGNIVASLPAISVIVDYDRQLTCTMLACGGAMKTLAT